MGGYSKMSKKLTNVSSTPHVHRLLRVPPTLLHDTSHGLGYLVHALKEAKT